MQKWISKQLFSTLLFKAYVKSSVAASFFFLLTLALFVPESPSKWALLPTTFFVGNLYVYLYGLSYVNFMRESHFGAGYFLFQMLGSALIGAQFEAQGAFYMALVPCVFAQNFFGGKEYRKIFWKNRSLLLPSIALGLFLVLGPFSNKNFLSSYEIIFAVTLSFWVMGLIFFAKKMGKNIEQKEKFSSDVSYQNEFQDQPRQCVRPN